MEDYMLPEGDLQRRGGVHLTSRESEVVRLVQEGLTNKEIALNLGIRVGTVKIHLKHIFEKSGVHGRYSLVAAGLQQRARTVPEELTGGDQWTEKLMADGFVILKT